MEINNKLNLFIAASGGKSIFEKRLSPHVVKSIPDESGFFEALCLDESIPFCFGKTYTANIKDIG